MPEKDPLVEKDEAELAHLDEEIAEAREHLKEETHQGERYFYEDDPEGDKDKPATPPS
jgi:hypothetical protein